GSPAVVSSSMTGWVVARWAACQPSSAGLVQSIGGCSPVWLVNHADACAKISRSPSLSPDGGLIGASSASVPPGQAGSTRRTDGPLLYPAGGSSYESTRRVLAGHESRTRS